MYPLMTILDKRIYRNLSFNPWFLRTAYISNNMVFFFYYGYPGDGAKDVPRINSEIAQKKKIGCVVVLNIKLTRKSLVDISLNRV